jgi:hypothetical protein
MRTHFLAAFFIIIFMAACKKEMRPVNEGLSRKWQMYSFKIVKIDDNFNQGACDYRTQASDFYDPPSLQSCRADDVYDFTNSNTLKIYFGNNKCMPNEASSLTLSYERKSDSLFIDGNPYRIVLLTKDTLILDYCSDVNLPSPIPVLNRAKLGMKFIAVKD